MSRRASASIMEVKIDGVVEPLIEVLSVDWSMGGSVLDSAHMRLDADYAVDNSLLEMWVGGWCEIFLRNDHGTRRVHAGRIAATDITVGRHTSFILESRLEPYHFSRRLSGILVLNNFPTDEHGSFELHNVYIDQPTIFNPYFQDRRTGNRSRLKIGNSGVSLAEDLTKFINVESPMHYFLDLQQSRTNRAQLWSSLRLLTPDIGASEEDIPPLPDDRSWVPDVGGQLWTLGQAVMYLCWTLNPEERYIRNPSLTAEQIDAQFFGEGNDATITNRQIHEGSYLNQALDELLDPYRLTWYVDYGTGEEKPKIVIHRMGTGAEKFVSYYTPSIDSTETEANLDDTNCSEFRLHTDISRNLANCVTVIGDYPQREITHKAYTPWRMVKAQEALTDRAKTRRDNDDHINDAELQRIAREYWVNEAQDMSSLPSTFDAENTNTILTTPGLSDVFDDSTVVDPGVDFAPVHLAAKETSGKKAHAVTRRRPFMPMLTKGDDGRPLVDTDGCYVEFNVTADVLGEIQDEDAWRALNSVASFSMLKQHAGFRIDNADIPEELNLKRGLRYRITGTVQGDARVREVAATLTSPNPDPVELFVHQPRYTVKEVHSSSIFYNTDFLQDEQNDRVKMRQLAEQLLYEYNQAAVACSFTIIGLHADYVLGDRITRVKGRGILLDARLVPPAYPEVTQIRYDYQNQVILMSASTYRKGPIANG